MLTRVPPAILIIALLLSVPSAAGAVGKITEDPNTLTARPDQESEDAPKTDPRLAQKVTYEAKGERVLKVLTDLEKMTGVKLYAGYNDADWQVRDRKMNIFAKDIPLAQLMSSIARVMKFKWSIRGEPEAYTYRLYMDRRALLDAESQRLRAEEQYRQRQAERRQKMLEEFGKLGDLSEEDLAKLKQENPFMYIIATTGLGKSLGTFFGGAPSALEALATGQELSLSGASLSPAAQQGLVQAIGQLYKLQSRFGGHEREIPVDLASSVNGMIIQLNREMAEWTRSPDAEVLSLLGTMHIMCPDEADGHLRNVADVPFFDPESAITKVIGEMLLQSEQEGRSMEEIAKGRAAEFMGILTSERKKSNFGEQAPEHPDDPDLQRKVKLDAKGRMLEDFQAALAKASGFAVVSDSFGFQHGRYGPGDEEAELREVLDKIAEGWRYNWDKHGPVIEFRDRYWFRKRAAQIPEAWLEAWRKTLQETGTLGLDDLAQIAVLSQEQMVANVYPDQIFARSGVARAVASARDPLRLYAALSQAQKSMIYVAPEAARLSLVQGTPPGGLDLRALTPDQWPTAQKIISRRNAAYLTNPEAQINLLLTLKPADWQQEQDGGDTKSQPTYLFRATTSDGYEPIVWTLHMPQYRPPSKEEPKKEDLDKPAPTQQRPDENNAAVKEEPSAK